MSDRGTVVFVTGEEKSVVISSYWGGEGFVRMAKSYAEEVKQEVKKYPSNLSTPLTRREPEIIAAGFIYYLVKKGWITAIDSGTYLGRDEKFYNNVCEIPLD